MTTTRDLRKEYEAEQTYRDAWLLDAEDVASLTIPSIRVRDLVSQTGTTLPTQSRRNGTSSGYGNSKPFSSVGRDGVNNLSNTLLTLLFPISVNWFRLTLDDDQRRQLIDNGVFETEEQIDEVLASVEDRMLTLMDEHLLRSQLHALFKRNLIEGNNVLHIYRKKNGKSAARLVPFRDMVVKRSNGEVSRLYLRGETSGPDGKPRDVYTCVDYESGKVWRQEVGGKRKTAQEIKGDRASYYVVITSTRPTVEDYAESYAHELIGDLNLSNSLTRSIDRAYTIFSKTILVNDSTASGIDLYDLADLQPGEAIEGLVTPDGRAAGIGFVSAGNKPSETAVAAQWLERIEDRLMRQFGGGISNLFDNLAQPRSATEIAQVASELDKFVSGLGQHYHAVLLRPLAQAYLDLAMEEAGNDPQQSAIKPQIIAGTTQLSRLQELSRFMQLLSTQLSLNPQFAQQIKWREVWRRMTKALGLDTDDILKSEEELQAEQQAQLELQQQLQQEQIDQQQLQALRQQRINDNLGDVA
ncbi:MAG: portal protein [Phycisphaerales bacterium JB047]